MCVCVCVLVLPMTIIQWWRRQLNGEIASILCTYFVVHTQIAVPFLFSPYLFTAAFPSLFPFLVSVLEPTCCLCAHKRSHTHTLTWPHIYSAQYAVIYHFWDNYRFVLKVDFIEVCSSTIPSHTHSLSLPLFLSISWFTFIVISRIAIANSIPFIRFYYGAISIHCKNVCVCVVRLESNSASDNGDDDDDDDNNNHHHCCRRRKIIVFCSALSND